MNERYGEEVPSFQRMSSKNQQELQQLKSDYRQIILNYFVSDGALKDKIDKFVNKAFNYNLPIPQIIEIHMEVIDELSKKLKVEGRSDDILLDYRLTLIDVLAHLCEIYRSALR